MRPDDDSDLVSAWIALSLAEPNSPEHGEYFWAFMRADELCTDDPDRAWRFILAVLANNQSSPVVGHLSAGPLEDLLARHPYKIIERVESEARRNPHLASLLGGVWQNRMPDDVWQRVQSVWDRRGWDGVPTA
jgi:hypothetical protein